MKTARSMVAVVLLALVALVATGCGSDAGSGDGGAGATTTAAADGGQGEALEGEITVSAAASLTEAYTQIGADFETAHPGTTVTFTFDSSGTLSQQILDGAPVDAFASADEANMAKLTDQDLVDGEPQVFARNQLVIVTKPGNPAGIEGLADLPGAGVVALCAASAPCGRFAAQVLEGAGVALDESSVTRGQNAKATLTAVAEGDAAAGIVYVTDARAAGDAVAAVAVPEERNAVATYPIGVLAGSGHLDVARAFAEYVLGDEAQAVLKEHGFLPPS
ncbi:MAG: molybdate ABC transporter substrate-binding protein [Acidimicrobiales bacterium]